ncbi:hypothetical protein ACJMK2_026482 [Sinanodonta woodiana]|uniref:Receptor ligand binding region domain-containing protein n=1 Tax=Sinanodonta woodiana TaxID=1069815 RepID=A0ABD3XK62_SINWO
MCKGSGKEENVSRVITLATLIPADEFRLFSIRRVEPAMEIAIETVKRESILNASTDLVLKFRDSKCDIADGINEAINFYVEKCSQNHELHVIFGPCCDYTAAPVARQVRYWNIPMITPGAMARDFALGKSNVFSHVTRVGPNFNSLVNFVVSLLYFYKWGKVNLIYEPEGHTEILKRYCHIAVDGLHYGLRSQANIPRLEQIYYKFENVTEALQNLPKWIGRSTASKYSLILPYL